MTRGHTFLDQIVLGTMFGLLFMSNLHADESAFFSLGAWIEEEAESKGLPLLSVILVGDEGVIWSYGVGKDARNPRLVADNDTTYRIGSISKLFTDIVVMQFVEKGVLDLDEPVQRYLPDFEPESDFDAPITLRLLMSHSSGLVREPPIGNYFDATSPSLAETVASLNQTMLVYEPGSRLQYSNAGIAVVGRVLEKVSGQPFAQVLQERALMPLAMGHSSFTPNKDVVANLPEAYMWRYQGDRTIAPTFELGMQPAGSMFSTMSDLALFMNALIKKGKGKNGRILSEKSLNQMWTPQSTSKSGRGRSYGIGFNLSDFEGELSVSHGGAIYGFATQLKVLPGSKIGVAIATNLDMANGAVNRIADQALGVLLAYQKTGEWPDYHVSNAISADAATLLVGMYGNKDGTIQVSLRFGDVYIERIEGLSLRLRDLNGQIVVDDIMAYSDDIAFSERDVTVFGKKYVRLENIKPAAQDNDWADLIGEYGFDHNIVYIGEKFGQLNALIEWGTEYPLADLGGGRFQFPPYGLYPNEQLIFSRNNSGKIRAAILNGIEFERRAVGDIEGDVFQITPVEPVADLEREALRATPPIETGKFRQADLVDITEYSKTIKLDIRYASENNFLGVPVYSSARAFLQRPAAEALARISNNLAKQGFGLLVHDAYRPWYVSKIFWDATPEESKIFVADPADGSRHNRGCAIDLTLYDLASGAAIEMVGLYDEMSQRSYPHYPGGTSLQRWHRELLIAAMEAEEFTVYEYEWWHFDFDGWENYKILTDTFEALDSP